MKEGCWTFETLQGGSIELPDCEHVSPKAQKAVQSRAAITGLEDVGLGVGVGAASPLVLWRGTGAQGLGEGLPSGRCRE